MIRRLLIPSLAVLALAACKAPEPAAPAPEAPVTPPAAPAGPAASEALTAQGWGPIRIGMTLAEVETALGADSNPEAVGGPDPAACDIFHPARAPEGLRVMVESGVLTSIWLDPGATVKTDRGFGIGDQGSAVKAAYGAAARVTPHKYVEAPAEYVTIWSVGDAAAYVRDPAARGLVYHIGDDGRVQHVGAGGPSIQYVEGCS